MNFLKRFFQAPAHHFFLLGPRGTGKSTWLRQYFKDTALWIDLLQADLLRSYLAYPERLKAVLEAHPDKTVVVIDEIQKAPALLAIVHSLIEEKRGKIQFILTGSSSRKLRSSQVNLLGGRALYRVMHPFVAAELGDSFSLAQALSRGMLPLVYQQQDSLAKSTLQAYVQLYLKEEVYSEGLVRNLEHFARFLEVISFSHAAIVNMTNIAAESGVKRKTVENYMSILYELLLGFTLQVFTKKAKRELSSHPKFYFFDAGVFYILRPKGPLDKPEEIEGAALEGLVASHLRAWISWQSEDYTLSFWRTRSGVEVDFIVYGPAGIWAIEVKNSRHVNQSDTNSLCAFLEDYPMAKAFLLYRGTESFVQKKVLCMPCEVFLKGLTPQGSVLEI